MNITKLAALAVAAIIIIGCSTPPPHTAQLNPNKGIVFVDGKPYLIPYGSDIVGGDIDGEDIAELKRRKVHHNCRRGDRMWMEAQFRQTHMNYYKSHKLGKKEVYDMLQTGLLAQRMGCSSALSTTEYDYYNNAEGTTE